MDLGLRPGQARQVGPRGRGQAAVVEPVMLLRMEQRMEELYMQGGDRWQAFALLYDTDSGSRRRRGSFGRIWRSLRGTSQEQAMTESGLWKDTQ